MGIAHFRFLARAAGALAIAVSIGAAAPAFGAFDEGTNCQTLAQNTCLGDPIDATAPVGKLGSPASPEEDLTAALELLKYAPSEGIATTARGRALAILEGDTRSAADGGRLAAGDENFFARKAYAGIPLLNTAAKVTLVPAPTADKPVPTVDVHEVRYGDHAILDTSVLRFANMNAPFAINWYVTEVGTTFGGVLAPTAAKATAAQASVWQPLNMPGLNMGTKISNRFHPGGDTEETRLATQMIPVQMGPPSTLGGTILDPNLKPGSETFAQIAIDDASNPHDPTLPKPDQVSELSAIGQLHGDLDRLVIGPDLTPAHNVGKDDAALVFGMGSRDTLPKSDVATSADVNVQFSNAEAFVDRRNVRVGSSGSVTFSITNLDDVDRHFDVRQLRNRLQLNTQGVLSWGRFDSDMVGPGVPVPANTTVSVSYKVDVADDAFSLWIGDPNGGAQAGWAIALDRGPRKQSLELGTGPVKPLHQALDSDGKLWVTLANTDEVARITPGGDLSASGTEIFPLPGGINDPDHPVSPAVAAVGPLLGPGDVRVDSHGIVWVTLGVGNAIARINPADARNGSTAGITVHSLKPCTEISCRAAPVPGAAAAPLSRIPLQMRLYEDGGENTVIFFTEQGADSIGVLRFTPAGDKLDEQHLNCDCLQPLGIALDPSGDVWFTEGSSNRLGHMTLDPTKPFSAASKIVHYNIPNAVCEAVPGQAPNGDPACNGPAPKLGPLVLPNPALTTLPHSVAVDRQGRVWYSGEASERIGYLDPSKGKPGTKLGFEDAPGPKNEFGRSLAPADMAIDAAGTVFFSDEYGDQIATAKVGDAGQVETSFAFRPSARNSLTDSPLIDPSGNLWFLEAGANMITRISGVGAGVPLPSRAPLLVANTATGRVTGSDLSTEISSLDVRVLRGTTLVAHADAVRVSGGSFATTVPLRADDRIEFVPHGTRPPATFSFRVAKLTAGLSGSGGVAGSALTGDAPLADGVTIESGGKTVTAPISADDGSFSWRGPSSGGTVSWTAGNVSARFRTVSPIADVAAAPSTPAGGAAPAPTLIPATPAAPATSASEPQAPACATARWLVRTGSGAKARRALPLLGLTADDAQRCVGRPAKRTGAGASQRWTYRGLELVFTNGRVSAFTLRGAGLASAPDRAAVGASVRSFRTALGTLARSGKSGYRAVVAVGADRAADVRLATSRSGRVTRVSVTLKPRAGLDAAGRRLLRGAR
jgi:streptogramin lyase